MIQLLALETGLRDHMIQLLALKFGLIDHMIRYWP